MVGSFRELCLRPLVLNRVHWVPPELVAEVKYLTWTDDNLLRQVVYEGLREDKPAAEVRLPVPHPKPVVARQYCGDAILRDRAASHTEAMEHRAARRLSLSRKWRGKGVLSRMLRPELRQPSLIEGQSAGAMRGSGISEGRTGRRSELSQIDVLLYLVQNRPGRSALELSQAIHGDEAGELRVQQDLQSLVSRSTDRPGAIPRQLLPGIPSG
jgi:hypothetical protein